jgi:hypothetical protein
MAEMRIQHRVIFDNPIIPVRYAWEFVDNWLDLSLSSIVNHLRTKHSDVGWDVYVDDVDENGMIRVNFEETSKLIVFLVREFQFKLLPRESNVSN